MYLCNKDKTFTINNQIIDKDMYRIKKSDYCKFAEQIAERAEEKDWFSGVVEVLSDGLLHRLELTMVIYRDPKSRKITDVADVWWDSCTFTSENYTTPPMINDFDFGRLCEALLGSRS